jgi:hypothetical protein
MNSGLFFRSDLEILLYGFLSENWNEINDDEWILHAYVIDLVKKYLSIKKSIFHHSSEYMDGRKILNIDIDYLWLDNLWYKISFSVRLNQYDAYKYDPREGF